MTLLTSYLIFLIQMALTASLAYMAVRILHRDDSSIEKIICFFLYGFGIVIVVMTLLGIFKVLSFGALMAALMLGNVCVFFVSRNTKGTFEFSPLAHPSILLAYLPLILFLSLKLLNASFSSVTETDSLVYHLPFAAKWFQTGSLWEPYYTAYAGPLGYYPGNYELITLFSFFPLRLDLLANLVNFAIFLPLALVLYAIAIKLRISSKRAALAPALLLFTPLVIRQGGIPQNDLFFLFTLATAVYFGMKSYLEDRWGWRDMIPIGLGLGLFLGTKSSGVIYGGIVIFLLAIFLLWTQKREAAKSSLLLFAMTILAGGFWYLRNAMVTGNPLFPLDLKIGSLTVLSGYAPLAEMLKNSALISHMNIPTLQQVAKSLFLSMGLFGFVGVVGFLLALFPSVQKEMGHKELRLSLLMMLLFPLSFALYLITPFSYANIYPNIRYLLVFFMIGYILFLLTSKMRGAPFSYAVGLANFLLIAFQDRLLPFINDYTAHSFKDAIQHPGLALLSLITIGLFLGVWWLRKRVRIATGLALIFSFGFFLFFTAPIREQNSFSSFVVKGKYIFREEIVKAFEYADKYLPEDARIAFTRGPAHYPLYGKRWKREVDYININECFGCLYHDYRNSPKSIVRDPNYDAWIANLKKARKEYLFIGQKTFETIPPYELTWAHEHPDVFELLFENETSVVYRIHL